MLLSLFILFNVLSITFLLIALKYKDLIYYVMSSTFALLIAIMILSGASGLSYKTGYNEYDKFIYGDNLTLHWDTSVYSGDPSGLPPNQDATVYIVHQEHNITNTYTEIRPFWSNSIGLLYLCYSLYMLFISFYTYKARKDTQY